MQPLFLPRIFGPVTLFPTTLLFVGAALSGIGVVLLIHALAVDPWYPKLGCAMLGLFLFRLLRRS